MKEIIGDKPFKVCTTCGVKFSFDSSDVEIDNEQYWAGLRWGYQIREVRCVRCPVCYKSIKLK